MSDMVDISAQFEPGELQKLKDLGKAYPDIARRVWLGTLGMLLSRLRKTVRTGGGKYGVPKFAPRSEITRLLHGHGPTGGILATDAGTGSGNKKGSGLIRWWSSGVSTFRLGYLGKNIGPLVEKFQRGDTRPFTWPEVKWIKKEVPRGTVFGGGYHRPARPILEPFAQNQFPEIPKYMMKRMNSMLAKEIAKQKGTPKK